MIFFTWVLLLILLTFLFSRWLDHQNNPNRQLLVASSNDGNAELRLKRNRMGHYVAPGLIDDVPVVFLLDTGATNVAIPKDIADKAGLTPGPMASSMTANGVVRSWLTVVGRVQLGPFSMLDVRATILPTMPGSEVLLGMSFLKHLEIMQKGDELILRLPD